MSKIDSTQIQPQQSWQSLSNSTGTVTTTLGYMKDTLGFVHLRGQLNMTGTGTFAVLPAGYRPEQYKEFGTSTGGTFGVMSVDTSGNITKIVGGNGNIDIDCVTFLAGN